MIQITNSIIILSLAALSLAECIGESNDSPNTDNSTVDQIVPANTETLNTNLPSATSITDQATAQLDGSWLSNCVTRNPEDPTQFEQEFVVVNGSSYERTINYYQDSDCSVPSDISFLTVRSLDFQYTGGTVQTALGPATLILRNLQTIDFDRRLLTLDEAALFDPALYLYDFYLIASDGHLYFGSLDTFPTDQFEQTLDSPHVFSAQ